MENGSFIGGGAKSLFKDITMMENLVFSVKLTIYGLGERPFCVWEVRDALLYILHYSLLFALNMFILFYTIVLQQSVTARLNS